MREHGRSSCRPARHNSCGSERKQRRPNGYSLIPLIQSTLSPPALLKEAGLPDIRFHDLRHTFATHALSSGVDAKTLAGILGHTKASFTLDTYTHTTGDMHQRAAEIVGGFLTDYLGEEMNPWQSRENMAAAPSV